MAERNTETKAVNSVVTSKPSVAALSAIVSSAATWTIASLTVPTAQTSQPIAAPSNPVPIHAWPAMPGSAPGERTLIAYDNGRVGLFAGSAQEVAASFGIRVIGAGAPSVAGWYWPEDVDRSGTVDMGDMTRILSRWLAVSPSLEPLK